MIDTIVRLIGWVAPPTASAWIRAMCAEIAAIPDARVARRFALGCLRAALILRWRAAMDARVQGAATVLPEASTSGVVSPRLLAITTHGGCAAAAIGVLYLVVAKAPLALVLVNAVTTVSGVLLVQWAQRVRLVPTVVVNGAMLAIALTLLLTAAFGHAVDGVSRWMQVGAFSLQTSLVLLPLAVLLFAHTVNRWTTAAMVAIAAAVALQPDRAMAFALLVSLLALWLARRPSAADGISTRSASRTTSRAIRLTVGAAATALLLTTLQADPLPAVPFVDHILWSAFRVHPLLGAALWVGSLLLFAPLLVTTVLVKPPTLARAVCLATAVCWGAIVAAASAGAYPTPVVGYGAAAILGYFLCLAALGALTTAAPASLPLRDGSPAIDPHEETRTTMSRWPVRDRIARDVLVGALGVFVPGASVGAQGGGDDCVRPPVRKVEGPAVWQPTSAGRQEPIWPADRAVAAPASGGRPEYTGNGSPLVAGRPWHFATYVATPTMTIYRPARARGRAAMVVLPGGGYAAVAMDLEGTEICEWVTAQGMTCVLLKYRVPQEWPRDARGVGHPPAVQQPLQDVQRTIGVLRARSATYDIDPRQIGVIGFSAGGHLAAAVSNAGLRSYPAVDSADRLSSIPDFAILLYPGRLWDADRRRPGLALAPWVSISRKAPPTLLIHAMNDPVDDVRHSAAYGLALHDAGVPVDMRFYARGCHAFGIRATADPITTEWPDEVVRWLQQRGVLPSAARR